MAAAQKIIPSVPARQASEPWFALFMIKKRKERGAGGKEKSGLLIRHPDTLTDIVMRLLGKFRLHV
jgi:hypothetical protein